MTHFSPQDSSPKALGFAMPAEWEAHAATWMSYPADNEQWFGQLEGVRREHAQLVRTISHFEPVHLLVRDAESQHDAQQRLKGCKVTFHSVALDDVWLRDNGPLFVRKAASSQSQSPTTQSAQISFINFRFNAWGGKFGWQHDDQVPEYIAQYLGAAHWDMPQVLEGGAIELNGTGVGLTTRSCLLSKTRNAKMSEDDYAQLLQDYLGIKKLLWLDDGLENDHTDGHIDTIVRFVNSRTIVTSSESNPADPNHSKMSQNRAQLLEMSDVAGQPFKVIDLPLPAKRLEGAEGRLPPTYANFYVGNGFVAVPQYHDANDQLALSILQPLFPERQVIGLDSRYIIEGGGSFHCLTQQQPAGQIWEG